MIIKEIEVDGVRYSIQAENTIKVTWAELKALRDEAKLNAGSFYRITDYVTTTTQSETKSANHPFDVIVLALSENTLCEDAKAILHEGDEYFAHCDLGAWKLMYCLDNDKSRFAWADETNGKGVIYRMVDEKSNDCPYDFKNILFYNTTLTSNMTSDKYYYTFSYVISGVLYDGTTEKKVKNCRGNRMGEYWVSGKLNLNKNVFRNTSYDNTCRYNTFGNSCCSNTFEHGCDFNTFLDSCSYNTFGYNGYINTFGHFCTFNVFGGNCAYNTFGDFCESNTFGDFCYKNTFKGNCHHNKFSDGCERNTFGYGCYSNNFENSCSSNKFGDALNNHSLDSNKTSITLNEEFYDDGSGQVVPVKHPDLSTQPSILPYKFMGHYVYERLIPISESLEKYANKLVLSAEAVGKGCCKAVMIEDGVIDEDVSTYQWVKIVYTTMPEDGAYYGYNQSGVVIPDTGMVIQMPYYVDNLGTNDGVKAMYLGDNLYHFPLDYIQGASGRILLTPLSGITGGNGNYNDVGVIIHEYGTEIVYPNEDFIHVILFAE